MDSDYTLVDTTTISNLQPNTTYHYRITTHDQIGNTFSTPDDTFMTWALVGTGEGTVAAPDVTVNTPVASATAPLLISGIETSFLVKLLQPLPG